MNVRNILFDLDGTLIDPKEGITKSIQYSFKKLGRPVPEPDELLWCIGPPLLVSFKKMLYEDSSRSLEAVNYYRERYKRKGKFENKIYDGITDILYSLSDIGLDLYVATSKPYVFAKEITDYYDITKYFNQIYGSRLNGELSEKSELIAHIVKSEKLSTGDSIFIGDRRYDVLGAKKNNIQSLGVTYGYGSEKELLESGAEYIAHIPSEILYIIKLLMSE